MTELPRRDDVAPPGDVRPLPDSEVTRGGAPFKVGDRVRLRHIHRNDGTIPRAGEISTVQAKGAGQWITINHRKTLAGYYELEPSA